MRNEKNPSKLGHGMPFYPTLGFLIFAAILTLGVPGPAYGQKETVVKKSFENIEQIQLNTFGGHCNIVRSEGSVVNVKYIHTFSNIAFEPKVEVDGKKLVLKEKFKFSRKGRSEWFLKVPDKILIDIKSISGDLSIVGLTSTIDATTVSGKIEVRNCRGELYLKSINGEIVAIDLSGTIALRGASSDIEARKLTGAVSIVTKGGDVEADTLDGAIDIKAPSGDIRINNAKGVFAVKVANGDVTGTNITFTKKSWINAASGNVYIELAEPLTKDLLLSSQSGNAILNYNNHTIEGFFQLTAMRGKGQTIAPYPFEKEEVVEKWGKKFNIKSLTRELDIPRIEIKTTTGKAILRKK